MQQHPPPVPGARARRRRRALAALAAVTALAACTQDGGDDAAPEPPAAGGEATAPATPLDLEGAQEVGEPVEQERFTVTVEGFDCEADEEVAALEPSGRFCVLALEVTNNTDTAQAFEPGQQVMLDEAGTEYGYSSEATQAADEGEDPDVEPGEAVTVQLVYDIPAEVTIVAARVRDAPDDDGVIVELGQ